MKKKIKSWEDVGRIIDGKVDVMNDIGKMIPFIYFIKMTILEVQFIINNGEHTYVLL